MGLRETSQSKTSHLEEHRLQSTPRALVMVVTAVPPSFMLMLSLMYQWRGWHARIACLAARCARRNRLADHVQPLAHVDPPFCDDVPP